ncbi:MAG: preprotein translocase subunit SecG [Candidatus Stahlbacteria bacterium]|nr:MAG: preprotein translocase subunit SecG [Candidatus Stahlbacteria bacterium]
MQAVFVVILALHILLSLLLVVIVLVQQRSKGGMAGVFGGGGGGGGGAEQIFGSSGVAPFMTRITTILGAVYLMTSLLLVLFSGTAGGVSKAPAASGQPQQTAPIPQPALQAEGQKQEAPQEVPGRVILPDTAGGN